MKKEISISVATLLFSNGCMMPPPPSMARPAAIYSQAVKNVQPDQAVPYQAGIHPVTMPSNQQPFNSPSSPQLSDGAIPRARFASESFDIDESAASPLAGGSGEPGKAGEVVTNMEQPPVQALPPQQPQAEVYEYRSQQPNIRDYRGPLALGDPGLSASLWRETRSGNNLYRDHRAFQAMDLLTIIVTESSEGNTDADTEIKSKSSVFASIADFLGVMQSIQDDNPNVNPDQLIKAETQNDFKGEGETNRRGSLSARISAMVVEVLPSGILRVEGEKIVSVNNEEQVMVISGLVRPYDLNWNNEVDSSRVANMRIDFYGKGTVGEAQYGGWMSRLMRTLWPF